MKYLSDEVYKRADSDARELLTYLKDAISDGAVGAFRINNWHPIREWDWDIWSEIYQGVKGRKTSVGWIALDIGYGTTGFRLIGSMNPRRGGLDGRRKFAQECNKKIGQVHLVLVSDDKEGYPDWEKDCIIWFDKKLTLQTSRDELRTEITTRAKKLAAVSKPLLSHV